MRITIPTLLAAPIAVLTFTACSAGVTDGSSSPSASTGSTQAQSTPPPSTTPSTSQPASPSTTQPPARTQPPATTQPSSTPAASSTPAPAPAATATLPADFPLPSGARTLTVVRDGGELDAQVSVPDGAAAFTFWRRALPTHGYRVGDAESFGSTGEIDFTGHGCVGGSQIAIQGTRAAVQCTQS